MQISQVSDHLTKQCNYRIARCEKKNANGDQCKYESTYANMRNTFLRRTVSNALGSERGPGSVSVPDIVAGSSPYISLPYKGLTGDKVLKNLKCVLQRYLPANCTPRFIYKGTKIGSFFRVKDPVEKEHQSNLVYHFTDPENEQQHTEYVGETNVRLGTRIYEHLHTDKASAIGKYLRAANMDVVESNFRVLDRGFDKLFDRKIAEALHIKERQPILNRQVKSYKLQLFN